MDFKDLAEVLDYVHVTIEDGQKQRIPFSDVDVFSLQGLLNLVRRSHLSACFITNKCQISNVDHFDYVLWIMIYITVPICYLVDFSDIVLRYQILQLSNVSILNSIQYFHMQITQCSINFFIQYLLDLVYYSFKQ